MDENQMRELLDKNGYNSVPQELLSEFLEYLKKEKEEKTTEPKKIKNKKQLKKVKASSKKKHTTTKNKKKKVPVEKKENRLFDPNDNDEIQAFRNKMNELARFEARLQAKFDQAREMFEMSESEDYNDVYEEN